MCWVAMLRPTSVLPAPGTPVTKQIDLHAFARECSITPAMDSDVVLRLMAVASLREISATECPL